jgi:hypothetical protein
VHTLGDMAKAFDRPVVYLAGLQKRFELPVLAGAGYSDAYLAFLQTALALDMFAIGTDRQVRLWKLEKRLLELLHVDSTGSKTWFLDSCGATTRPQQRLLLTNHDLGVPLPSRELQLGLNFADQTRELFGGTEMGEDELRVLNECITLTAAIRADLKKQLPHARAATRWATRRSR